MHASRGIVSLETWPQIGQVSCDVVIMRVLRWPGEGGANADDSLCEGWQQEGKQETEREARHGQPVKDSADASEGSACLRSSRLRGAGQLAAVPERGATHCEQSTGASKHERFVFTQPDKLWHRGH